MGDELFDLFLEETSENLQLLEEGLMELENDRENAETINVIFRAMHTIKGGAGLVGLQTINHLTHHLENLLDLVRNLKIELSDSIFQILFAGTDLLKKMIECRDFSGDSFEQEIKEITRMLQPFEGNQPKEEKSEGQICFRGDAVTAKVYKVQLQFNASILETGTDPLMLIKELAELGEIIDCHCEQTKLPQLEQLEPHVFYIGWTIVVQTDKDLEDIQNIFIFVSDDNQILIEQIPQNQQTDDSDDDQKSDKKSTVKAQDSVSTIRVETAKLEGILNHLAELLISQSRVKELVLTNLDSFTGRRNHAVNQEIITAFEEVDKTIRVIQEKVMNTSMIPIGGTFTRYQRMIRDLAQEVGKEVRVQIEGKDTELDKKVIEQMADPLKHLIRNAMDHGLEMPEERVRVGKPREGTIILRAFHQEGNIVIQLEDDGHGIDEQAVFAKAVEKKLIHPDDQLSREEIYMLLFKPGFSTAKQVTDISGRGVGLDVVINNIRNLRGTVELASELGKGTIITIKLPLTLAIIDGMMVRVGQERFIIPLNMISEFYKATPENIHRPEGKGVFIHLRGENLPLVALHEILHIEANCHSPTDGILVILQNNQRKVAMMVDDIIGQEQVVIKSLKENMRQQVEGVAGVTILGDGKVAIILDIPTIYKLIRNNQQSQVYAG